MDEFNTFTSKPSTTEETDLFGFGNTDEITNIQKDDSSWIIENISNMKTSSSSDILDETSPVHPSNDIWNNINSSEVLNSFNDDVFTNEEPLNTLPPTAEDILSNDLSNQQKEDQSSWNMFSNEVVSPIQAVYKKREQEIAAKDAEENRKIDELRKQAQNDLEHWYNERNKQMEQKRQTMKIEEDNLRTHALEKTTKTSCDWSKVISLLDFTDGKQFSKSKRDLTRMKSCIFNAKRISESKKLENGI